MLYHIIQPLLNYVNFYSFAGPCNATVKFNIMNLNRQAKLYSQGMRPLFKILPYQEQWERIKEKPNCSVMIQNFDIKLLYLVYLAIYIFIRTNRLKTRVSS